MRNVDSYCVRVGSLNVGTVTGKGRSLANMMETRNVVIKWWRLKEDNHKIKFRETVLKKVRPVDSVQDGGSRGARRF